MHFFFSSLVVLPVAVLMLLGPVLAYRELAVRVEFGAALREEVRRGLGWGVIACMAGAVVTIFVGVVIGSITSVDYGSAPVTSVNYGMAAGAAIAVLIPAVRGMSPSAEPAGLGGGVGRGGGLARWYAGIAAALVVAVTATAGIGSAIAAFARRGIRRPGVPPSQLSFLDGAHEGRLFSSAVNLPTGWDCWAVAVLVAVLAAVAVFAVARSRWAGPHQQTFRFYVVLATGSTAMVLVGTLGSAPAQNVDRLTRVRFDGATGGEVMPYADLSSQADLLRSFTSPMYFGVALMLLAIVIGWTRGKDAGTARSAGPRPHAPDAGSRPTTAIPPAGR